MSATPIDDTYLNALPEFQNVDYDLLSTKEFCVSLIGAYSDF